MFVNENMNVWSLRIELVNYSMYEYYSKYYSMIIMRFMKV